MNHQTVNVAEYPLPVEQVNRWSRHLPDICASTQ